MNRVVTMAFLASRRSGNEEWFAVSVDPRLVESVLASLGQKGYDAFTPYQIVVRKRRTGTAELLVPAFPGYIFARLDVRFRLPILTTPGVRGLVGYGKQPTAICEAEVEAIRRVMSSKLPSYPFPFVSVGDEVRLVEGPLTGLTGILIGNAKPNRVLIRVSLIQRALAVDVESDWLRPLRTTADPRVGHQQIPVGIQCQPDLTF